MATSENAKLQYEAGQTLVSMVELTDSGDQTSFNSASEVMSDRSGYEPVIRPNGLITGGIVTPADSETNNYVDTAALTCYLVGVNTTVAADTDVDCPRSDTSYLLLTLAASGYTSCVASDIGKTVTGGVTGDSGTLINYNNTTREWLVDPDAPEDTFDDDDEALTIGSGTGAGDLSAVGAAATYKINSITVNSSGAIAVVEGDEGISFSTSRGVPGSAPFIPTTSIEIAQVRYTSSSAAAVDEDEIFQVIGTHQERYDYPTFEKKLVRVTNQVIGYAGVDFASALPAIHTGSVPKKVYAQYYTPIFADISKTSDFVPVETTHSVNSTTIYGGAVASKASSIGQGSFTAYFDTGISDALVKLKNEKLWFKYFQNRLNSTPYVLTNGYLGIGRSFPADNQNQAACTISSEDASEEVAA